MAVTYQKSIDAKNGNSIRFLLVNFDYIDGNEYLVKLFVEEYGFIVQEKIDGLWYHIIRVSLGSTIYELLWHEDTGNEIYCINQTEKGNEMLQQRLEKILCILNTTRAAFFRSIFQSNLCDISSCICDIPSTMISLP